MTDKVTHVKFGVVLSVGLSVILSYLAALDQTTNIVLAIAGGFWGSILPDLLEPPRHYTHRGFFHSVKLLKRLPFVVLVGSVFAVLEPRFWFLFYVGFGYTLHLLVDAMTPMRLPSH